jgi:GT2 family glycosyltransferase
MAVDVVVVNYHTPDLLLDFINSYHWARFEGCTLTVVDVDTGAGNSVAVEERDMVTIGVHDNIGYARACNQGALNGENDVILLANADTLLKPGGLKECHDALISVDDWGVLGPRQVGRHNQITAGGIFGTDTNIGQRGWNEPDNGQYSDIRDDAKSVSGSLYFIKRKLWEELTNCPSYQEFTGGAQGAFLPTNFYYEETACSYHARAHGYKIVYYGPVQMIHYWHQSHPHGDWADMQAESSKQMMRAFCRAHGIVCE